MATPPASLSDPSTRQFFERPEGPATPGRQRLERVLVAPIYQIARAFDSSGDVRESSLVTWADGSLYRSGTFDNTPVFAGLPGLLQGGRVDPDWTDLFLQIGSGASSVLERVNSPRQERVLVSAATATLTVSAFDDYAAGLQRITVTGQNLPSILRGLALPGQEVPGAGVVTAPATPVNYLSESAIRLEFQHGGATRVVRIVGVDPANPSIAVVENTYGLAAGALSVTGLRVVSLPRLYDIHPAGRTASVPMAGVFFSATQWAYTGGTLSLLNADPVHDWDVEVETAGTADAPLSVSISGTEITVTLGTDSSGDLDPTKNTARALMLLLKTEFRRQTSSGHQMVLLAGADMDAVLDSDTPFTGPSGSVTLDANVLLWQADLRALETETAADWEISVLMPAGNDLPAGVQVGDGFVALQLGSDSSGDPDSSKNAIETFQQLLLDANAPVEIVMLSGDPATAVLGPGSLGAEINRAGWRERVWGVDPYLPRTEAKWTTTRRLRGGVAPGGVEIHGGILPTFNDESIAARFYATYRALRTDLSAAASPKNTGTRPNIWSVSRESVESLLGEVSTANPGALAAWEYLRVSNNRRCFVLSVDEVSAENPWGTYAATERALKFLQRRKAFHWGLLNDAYWVPDLALETIREMEGTMEQPLKKAAYIYYATKNPEMAPDSPIVSGSDANKDPLDATIITGSVDFAGSDVQAGDIIVFNSFMDSTSAPVTLQDGRRGWEIEEVSVGGSPYSVRLTEDGPLGLTDDGFSVVRRGQSLTLPNGQYDSEAAAEALYRRGVETRHPGLARTLVDRIEIPVRNQRLSVDGVYFLASFLGRGARHSETEPMSALEVVGVRRVEGTSSLYPNNETGLKRLAAGGYIMPRQDGDDDESAITTIYRDVSTDTSTRIFRRRTARVAEYLLALETEAIIQPNLGPNTVSPQWLDSLAGPLEGLVTTMRDRGVFDVLSLERLIPITNEVREKFNLDASGVLVVWRYRHREEASDAIVHHIIEPSS